MLFCPAWIIGGGNLKIFILELYRFNRGFTRSGFEDYQRVLKTVIAA